MALEGLILSKSVADSLGVPSTLLILALYLVRGQTVVGQTVDVILLFNQFNEKVFLMYS